MSDLLRHFVDVRQGLSEVDTGNGGEITGMLSINQEKLQWLKELEGKDLVRSEISDGKGNREYIDDISYTDLSDTTYEVTLKPSNLPSVKEKHKRGHYFKTLEELVNKFTHFRPDYDFYVHDNVRGFSTDDPLPGPISKYFDATDLAQLLISQAGFQRNQAGVEEVLFSPKGILKIPLTYEPGDMHNLDNLDQLRLELENDEEGETRREVFSNTLEDFLGATSPKNRFSKILNSFDELLHQYQTGYQRYIRQFSYEKLKSDFVNDKSDFIDRLNKTVNNVQNKLVAVPLAVLLAGGQLQAGNPLSAQNLAILLGSLLFATILHLLIDNQKEVLRDIGTEITNLEREYLNNEPDPPTEIKEGFERLTDAREKQRAVLNIFGSLVWIFFWSVSGLFIYYLLSPPLTFEQNTIVLAVWVIITIVIGVMGRFWAGLGHLISRDQSEVDIAASSST